MQTYRQKDGQTDEWKEEKNGHRDRHRNTMTD